MTVSIDLRLARLRGSLSAEELGARGLERVARNPECMCLRALTIIGITPGTAAERIYGESSHEGQSPFAIAIGNRFERTLIENGAAALLELFREARRLSLGESKVPVIPDLAPGISADAMARQRAESDRFLRLKLRRNPRAPI